MCGIAGVWRQSGPAEDREIAGMLARLRHRGPDGCAIARGRGWAMGMCRLAIIDPAGGRQPFTSEDGRVHAVFNGEVYNHRALRQWLERRGHRLTDNSDGQVLVHAYEEAGAQLAPRLVGMFAFAVWDERQRRLLLGRDPLGQKPLYVWEAPGVLAFASEIKALAAVKGFVPRIDLRWLPVYLAHRFVPAPHTLLAGVRKINPGEVWVVEGTRVARRWRYWQPAMRPPEAPWEGLENWADRLDALLNRVVAEHLESDVPWGLALSGGVDSSLLGALAAAAGQPPPRAFTAGWGRVGRDGEETVVARQVAQRIGVPWEPIPLSEDRWPDRLRHLARVLDEPNGDPTALSLDLLLDALPSGVRMLLNGEGADEVFAGYPGYGEAAALRRLRRIPPPLRRLWTASGLPGRGAMRRAGMAVGERYRGVGFTFATPEVERLLAPELAGADQSPEMLEYWRHVAELPELQQMQGFDLHWFLPDDALLKIDRVGMAHQVEFRSPYCDARVVELALTIPIRWRRSAGVDKRVLRRVARRYLPGDWVYRKKQGFPTPLARLMAGPLRAVVYEYLAPNSRQWFREDALRSLLGTAAGGRPGEGFGDWPAVARKWYTLVMLELWVREVVEGALRAPADSRTPSVLA